MKAKVLCVLFIVCSLVIAANAQAEGNLNVDSTPHAHVNLIADQGEYLWVATEWGLTRTNKASGDMTFYHERLGHGLPSAEITALTVDSQGNVWIGSNGAGLVKFDGTTWQVVNSENSSLPHDTIDALTVDNDGNLWIGTHGGGAVKYDGSGMTVYDTAAGLPNKIVNALAVDNEGAIWFGTNWGLGKFDGQEFTKYTTSDSDLPNNKVLSLSCDGSGKMCIGTSGGLGRFDGESWAVFNKEDFGLDAKEINVLTVDSHGKTWIGNSDGLAMLDGENWTVYRTDNSGLKENALLSLNADSNGNIWAGTHSGLVQYDGTNWSDLNTGILKGPDTWSRLSGLTQARNGHAASAVNGKIYVFGGYSSGELNRTFQVYDMQNDSWTPEQQMPENDSRYSVPKSSVVNGKIYIFDDIEGEPVTTVDEYDPSTETWSRKTELAVSHLQGSCKVYNGKIYVIGGRIPTGPMGLKHMHIYDPATNTWTETSPMPSARWGQASCTLNGKIYAIAGYDGGENNSTNEIALAVVEEYDPATDTWRSMGDMPIPRYIAAWGVIDDTIYYTAGFGYNTENWFPVTTEAYDPSTDTWTALEDIPQSRRLSASCVFDEKLYVIGGWDVDFNSTNDVYVYDPGAGSPTLISESTPNEFSLSQNYPNPFNPKTIINYQLDQPGMVNLVIYDLLGRKVATLVDEMKTPGSHAVTWDANGFASGVYFYRIESGDSKVMTQKMMLVK